jgi:imidazolonepropionase-like amidohydrolase
MSAEALALVDARVIDGSGAPARTGATVVLRDGSIDSVGEAPPPADASVLDLEGRTVVPGLIDAHVHLSSLGLPDAPDDLQEYGLALVARRMLEAGFTTIRDLGSYGDSLFRLRRAIGLGLCSGPRLVLCGQIVSATSPGAKAFPGMYYEADGPDGMRRAVREQISQGIDFVKVMSTGALTVADEDVNPAQLTADELAAVVDEAHRMELPVASHAEGLAGIRLSVEAGVDTLEHGEMGFQDPAVLATMAERGIILVPTLCVFDFVAEADSFPDWMRERAKFLRESAEKTVARARHEGVVMAAGADAGPHGENARELVRMVETGLRPMEAIVAATSTAARACRLEDELGTIEPGKTADLLVLDGDPLEDMRLFLDPLRRWLVLQEGRPVAGTQAGTAR